MGSTTMTNQPKEEPTTLLSAYETVARGLNIRLGQRHNLDKGVAWISLPRRLTNKQVISLIHHLDWDTFVPCKTNCQGSCGRNFYFRASYVRRGSRTLIKREWYLDV